MEIIEWTMLYVNSTGNKFVNSLSYNYLEFQCNILFTVPYGEFKQFCIYS